LKIHARPRAQSVKFQYYSAARFTNPCTIDQCPTPNQTLPVREFSHLIGKRVEARYRAGELRLSAVGNLVSDSGLSVCIEDRFEQNGREKKMRLEIPYQHIFAIEEKMERVAPAPLQVVPSMRTWRPPEPKRI
jgi:hypothetical protein